VFIEERHHHILTLIREKGRVEVSELSKIFQISEDSARRVLRLMEEEGLVKRTYGGAILPDKVGHSTRYQERDWSGPGVKDALAKTAAAMVRDGDTILLDGSPTIARMVSWFNKVDDLTIVTNSVAIAYNVMNHLPGSKLFMIGGLVDPNRTNTTSIESLNTIRSIAVDKAFVSPCSISPELELWSTSFNEAEIKKAMLEAGREVIILADSEKFGQPSLAHIGSLQLGYQMITDSEIGAEMRQKLEERIKKGLVIVPEGEISNEPRA
jgi:DeoR/GlpR family transcriptional regulator of sugar metabolism